MGDLSVNTVYVWGLSKKSVRVYIDNTLTSNVIRAGVSIHP